MDALQQLPPSWQSALAEEWQKPYFLEMEAFVASERRHHQVFPPAEDVFNAFKLTPYDQVKVLLLGQDPYHDDGQAHGLAFSVRPGVKPPPSLVNMCRELHDDVGAKIPNNGCLEPWARQGVMLLNTVLTVRAHEANSHKGKGWEQFTDAVIARLSARERPVVFVLWGTHARKKRKLIDESRHVVIEGVHPSPLSAHNGFHGSRPYSKINDALQRLGQEPVDWRLPDL